MILENVIPLNRASDCKIFKKESGNVHVGADRSADSFAKMQFLFQRGILTIKNAMIL